jgi:predicted aspartyl protease
MAIEPALAKKRGRERLMGKVYADITVVSGDDEALQSRGLLEAGAVRSVHLTDVLVDTGATSLCLPAEIIGTLGLRLDREVSVETATGMATARLFRGALLTVEGRTDNFSCVELPGGQTPLLGVIPMEALGLEPDLIAQRLWLLPETTENTHITIL